MVVRFFLFLFVKALVCVTVGHQLCVAVLWSWNIWRFCYLFILMMVEIISWDYILVKWISGLWNRVNFVSFPWLEDVKCLISIRRGEIPFIVEVFCFSRVDLSMCEFTFCPAVDKRNYLLTGGSLRRPGENRERKRPLPSWNKWKTHIEYSFKYHIVM